MRVPGHRFYRAVAGATAAVLALAGCAVFGEGPLLMSGGAEVCSWGSAEYTTYFGDYLDNTGNGDDVVVMGVRITESTNLRDAELLIDVEGPSLDQVVGSMRWPSEDGPSWAGDLLTRATDPENAMIAAGTGATLLLVLDPEDPSREARIEETALTYRSGGHVYTVYSHMRYVLAPGEAC